MWRRFFPVVVAVCLLFGSAARAQNVFGVNEAETRAFFAANRLETHLVLDNKNQNLAARVKLEILDTEDRIVAVKETIETIGRGRNTVKISLDLSGERDEKNLLWNRLRYTIAPQNDAQNAAVAGIVSLSEIMPEIFELRASAAEHVGAGMNYRVRVRAFHPVTNAPTAAVKINAELELETESDDDELKLTAAGRTDGDGYAILDFKIPANIKLDEDADLRISGEKNGVVREADEDLDALEPDNYVYLNTDKPIYQPNQNFYVRALATRRDAGGNAVNAAQELEFVIEDEDETALYRETVKTSRFGVASVGWKIPDGAKLGTYRIRVKDADGEQIGYDNFKVSRYELPNFTVTAKPDKTFYLPGENTAEIVVSAEYLFGKPVTKGAVRVVRETERRWSYANQKWEIDEAETLTGAADADGKFTTKVDLSKAHESLKESGYRRFEDLSFAAYFTDTTTNRTEQRRFDVRVSKEAIHVYLIDVNSYDEHNPKLPVSFYVSTFYADGAPAACAVEARGKYEDESDAQTRTLTRLKTNGFGAGKVEFAAPKRNNGVYKTDLKLKIAASDAGKKTGTQEEEIDVDADEKELQIRTPKTIYRAGEAINVELFFSETEADAFVDVAQNMSIVASRLVKIKNGRAKLSIPYNPNFRGELTLAAYIDGGNEAIKDARGIIYPQPNALKLGVAASKAVYRPNEEATLDFSVAAPGKKLSETALGVVVFDKAIEERARTDAEFGGGNFGALGNYAAFLSGGKSFGGVNISMINEMDARQKISPELQLAAEVMLANNDYYPNFFESDYYGANLKTKFENYFLRHSVPVQTVLRNAFNSDYTHPTDAAALQRILLESGVDFADMRDPWGNRYRADFAIETDENVVSIRSAGANETFDDRDDVIVLQMNFKYFAPVGNAVNRAVAAYHARTGAYIRDYATLKNELKTENVDLDNLKDRWNRPYAVNFGASGRFYTIDVQSFGADGKTGGNHYDDFTVWTNRVDYFAETEAKMQAVLSNYANRAKTFPRTENDFKKILKNGGVDFDTLRDGWNRPLYLEFATSSRYIDKVKTEIVGTYGGAKASEKLTITPVTQQLAVFRVRSAGVDLVKANYYDDFDLTTFSGVISEQSKADAIPIELKTETIFTGGKGAVRGMIADSSGAVIPNATITATNEETSAVASVASNDEGVFLLANLPSGKYTIRAEAVGFAASVLQNVPVQSSTVSILNIEMEVGSVSQVVEVTANAVQMDMTTNASIVITRQIQELPPNGRNVSNLVSLKPGAVGAKNKGVVTLVEETATPRLREYFPETLLWNPELVTDKNGRASVKFKLADSLTTWKLYAIGSNADGKIGVAFKEIKTFQPFFVDLEPPKFLTVGDEIGLPVQIRNYTEKAQRVGVKMAAGDWFSLLNAAHQTIDVSPNDSRNAIFNFRANSVVKAGKQRVTATAQADADAIEKTVAVRPDGKEIVQTQSDIFREAVAFDANFPANALPKTQAATLKIYPNLMAHVAESIEGLLQRPYGCGEQTISSTYPNLLILKAAAKSKNTLSPKLREKAEKYLRGGYERLVGYQVAGGGFSYWGGRDAPDIALTAYAIRFLTDAQDFIEVDEEVIERARKWLVLQQRADGSWTKIYYGETVDDKRRAKIFTTYIARVLAMTEKDKKEKSKDAQIALQKAFDYLKTRNAEIDEPFALASFALALFDAGEADAARLIAAKLETLAIAENGGAYWNLETNTPFYGWGTAGRIETTALVVQALEKAKGEGIKDKAKAKIEDQKLKSDNQNSKTENQNLNIEDLIAKGTLFLLKNKDRYGVWYSTQASVNVLDAILAVVAGGESENATSRTAEIFVNGRKAQDVKLPDAGVLAVPLEVDLAAHLAAGDNRVEVKIGGNQTAAMAQVVSTHYVAWRDFAASGRDTNQSRQLRLDYDCDKKTAEIMREINCRVRAERVGFRGYGMLLAEIGLPPGADVDRASLEKAKDANWSFSRYDVLPDRIIIYMWAQAGGTQIDFKFKPRYGVSAQTAPSIVYDYYNAEAQAVVAPLRFSIR